MLTENRAHASHRFERLQESLQRVCIGRFRDCSWSAPNQTCESATDNPKADATLVAESFPDLTRKSLVASVIALSSPR